MANEVENRPTIIVTWFKVAYCKCLIFHTRTELSLPRDCMHITEMGTDKRHKYWELGTCIIFLDEQNQTRYLIPCTKAQGLGKANLLIQHFWISLKFWSFSCEILELDFSLLYGLIIHKQFLCSFCSTIQYVVVIKYVHMCIWHLSKLGLHASGGAAGGNSDAGP